MSNHSKQMRLAALVQSLHEVNMYRNPLVSSLGLLAACALFAGTGSADAQYYGYTSFYAPTSYTANYGYSSYYAPAYGSGLGYGLFPGAAYRQAVRADRRAYRRAAWYGAPYSTYYGYGGYGWAGGCCNSCGVSDCCGTCGVVASYAPSCGCGISSCCDTVCGDCGSNCSSGSDVIVNSVPNDVEERQPTPVRPKDDDSLETFERGTTPLSEPDPRPTDDFRPASPDIRNDGPYVPPRNTTPPPGGSGLDDSLLEPLDALPDGPGSSTSPAGPDRFDDFSPGETGIESFRLQGDAPDDSAQLDTLPRVRVARQRIRVSARYGIPAMMARNSAIESFGVPSGAQIASVD